VKTVLRSILETAGAYAARPYITGARLEDALPACKSLQAHDYRSTICFWDGENDTAEAIVSHYDATILGVAELNLDCYVSVKSWPLRHSLDHFRHFSLEAKSGGVKLHFDSASTDDQEKVLQLIRELLPISGTLGYTLPGRWHRSLADAELAVERGLEVRVVKGQWADPSQHIDPSEGFLRVIERLAGRANHVSVATHDPKVARAALAALLARGTACELELLYGLPVRAVLPIAKEAGVPVRVYLPYGHAWLPYVVNRLRKEPRIALRLLRDLVDSLRLRFTGKEGVSRLPI
jgi:proline dehydrogenase